MKHIIYQITNTRNGKIYIGYHGTDNINDGYMGSGTYLKNALKIAKFIGDESMIKEILHEFETKEEALQMEKQIVNDEFVNREDTYNLKVGGQGGWDHTHKDPVQIEKRRVGNKKAIEEGRHASWKLTKEQRSALSSGENNGFYGKSHNNLTKQKISQASKIDKEELEKRIQDYINDDKSYGINQRMGRLWNISGQAASRFMKQNNFEQYNTKTS